MQSLMATVVVKVPIRDVRGGDILMVPGLADVPAFFEVSGWGVTDSRYTVTGIEVTPANNYVSGTLQSIYISHHGDLPVSVVRRVPRGVDPVPTTGVPIGGPAVGNVVVGNGNRT